MEENIEKNGQMSNSSDNSFFMEEGVENGGSKLIEIKFETLTNAKCKRPFDWYKDLELDKSYASKIRRGIIIPPKWLRIKIAQYFGVDSLTIWNYSEKIKYPLGSYLSPRKEDEVLEREE